MKVAEPAIAYNSVPLQQLKSRLLETIDGENRVVKLQQCLDLLRNDSEEDVLSEQNVWNCIPEETRHIAIEAAISDYKTGQCISQNEMNDWIKEKMRWK